jgi:hypothetical protein
VKDKYEFILNLIEHNKLTPVQKECILRLSAQELRNDGDQMHERIKNIEKGGEKNTELIKRIEEIENKLNQLKDDKNPSIKFTRLPKNAPEPNPKHVADFMSYFNQRDGLKYLTHDFDEDGSFNIDSFLISAFNIFEKTTGKLKIPTSLWRIVKQFAFDSQQTEWTSISEDYKKTIPIKIGWATKELRDWSKQNDLHPIRNEEYRKVINDFKRITRIEKSNLEKLVTSTLDGVFRNELEDFVVEKKNLGKADFYSHVGNLKIALEAIFEEILNRSDVGEKKRFSIEYEREYLDDYALRKIKIIHFNSYPSKELKLILSEWNEKGNMGKIKEKLRGYCHWSVETMIENTPARVNILKDKDTPEYEEIEHIPDGFTHTLTFYYK